MEAKQIEAKPQEKLVVEYVPTNSIHPMKGNPRKNAKAVSKVADSIKRFGWKKPILARRDGTVIAGHTRLAAAEKLHMTHVPVMYTDLSDADARLYNVADNKLGEIAEWDQDLLAELVTSLEAEDDDLKIVGFSSDELERLLAQAEETAAAPTTEEDEKTKVTERNFNVTYTLIFNTLDEQARWFKFLARLKSEKPNLGTVAERLMLWLEEHG